ncbi:MAG: D-glycero-alpha-D-manno-heptose-1,7-bisphosphate 7-phosphatase [Chloroflexota bacterium]
MRAFFFDRDGIVNKKLEGDYVKSPVEMDIFPGFVKFLTLVKRAGFMAILITNQQGVGKGLMTETDLEEVHRFMQKELLRRAGVNFDAIFYCPDLACVGSLRRKPAPGMLIEAIEKYALDPSECVMLGDSRSDAQAAKAAGVKAWALGPYTRGTLPEADEIFKSYEEIISRFIDIYDGCKAPSGQ